LKLCWTRTRKKQIIYYDPKRISIGTNEISPP
jgi:hypothetical protein